MSKKQTIVALLILTCVCWAQDTQEPDEKDLALKSLRESAQALGWPANPFPSKDKTYADKSFGVSAVGADAEVDKAYIALAGEKDAKKGLDTLQENGLRRTTYRGYDAIVMAEGEEICDAGGVAGATLGLVRTGAGFFADAIGAQDFDESEICMQSHGTIAWRCNGVLFLVNSPDTQDNSQDIATTLYERATENGLCKPVSELTGKITDGHGHPLPYLKVSTKHMGQEYETLTDKQGTYVLAVEELKPSEQDPPKITLRLEFTYVRDKKEIYQIVDEAVAQALLFFEYTYELKHENDTIKDIDFGYPNPGRKKEDGPRKSNTYLGNMHHFAATYFHTHEAAEFAISELKADIDHRLPVEVKVGRDDGTYYSPSTSYISIDASDASYSSTERPDNREYHEFAHHIMYAEYGSWPHYPKGAVNHAGYINPSTSDSYVEGFAEFMALAMSKHYGERSPHIYAGFGSMESDYKAWDWEGRAEELSVCGILWDLYDSPAADDDKVSLSLEDMWKVLKVKRDDFYQYYKAFQKEHPEKGDAIDEVFIAHGFFADTQKGNNTYDVGEPFRDGTHPRNNSRHDKGEDFIDLGTPANMSCCVQEYDKGETIGKATNYARTNRSKAVRFDNAYLKVDDDRVRYYRVIVDHNDPEKKDYEYVTDLRDGRLYIMPLPKDVDATFTVESADPGYITSNRYVIGADEYEKKYYTAQGRGFFDSHDFAPKPTGKKSSGYDTFMDVEPTHDNNAVDEIGVKDESGSGGGCCCFPALTLILSALSAIAYRI